MIFLLQSDERAFSCSNMSPAQGYPHNRAIPRRPILFMNFDTAELQPIYRTDIFTSATATQLYDLGHAMRTTEGRAFDSDKGHLDAVTVLVWAKSLSIFVRTKDHHL